MHKAFKDHIDEHMPRLGERPFFIACSGGLDSVVLAHLCHNLGMQFTLVHCNFKLRGAESDEDETFVRHLADIWGVPVLVKAFNVQGHIKTHGGSVQMAARELRYAWFYELLENTGHDTLLTAHHADDALETFLINLSRGSGLDGLRGIPMEHNGVWRPLLPFSRKTMLRYATDNGLQWREDSSNADTKYLRNQIRHKVVPAVKELHPTFLDNFLQTQQYLQDSSQMLENHIEVLRAQLFQEHHEGEPIPISIPALRKLHPLKSYLFQLFKPYGFTNGTDMVQLLNSISGKQLRSKTYRLIRDREVLLLVAKQPLDSGTHAIHPHDSSITTPMPMTIDEVTALGETAQNVLYVDKEKLNYPLVLRKWQKGDYFYPLGMQGGKKLSKFFKDEKMDMLTKESQWLLCSGDDIVWVVGRRADERFKVNTTTKTILKFSLK